jgi:hypothetical protein
VVGRSELLSAPEVDGFVISNPDGDVPIAWQRHEAPLAIYVSNPEINRGAALNR